MIYHIDTVIRDIKVCLDQNTDSTALLQTGDIDTLSVEEIIRSKVLDAVRMIHGSAPNYLLEQGHNFGDAIHWTELESGYIILPCDFFRLIVFEMDDWERAVYTAISTDDTEYEYQRSRFKGVRGTAQKPVCAIALRPTGRVLEFYSCKSTDAKVRRAMYLPYPHIDKDGGIDICERCYRAVVYTAAALVLATYGDNEKSNTLIELGKSTLV